METDDDAEYSALRAQYRASLANKQAALATAWKILRENRGDPAARRELAMQVHRLRGSAPAYGYPRLGELAGVAEKRLGEYGPLDAALSDAVEALLGELGNGR